MLKDLIRQKGIRLFSTIAASKQQFLQPPILSLKPYFSNNEEEKMKLAKEVLNIGSKDGFFYLTDLPMKSKGMGFLEEAKKYFKQPVNDKLKDVTVVKDGFTRGYLQIGSESGSPDLFERKEAFSYGFDEWDSFKSIKPSNPLEGYNTWPSNEDNFSASQFRKEANLFYKDNIDAAVILSCLIGLSLGVPEETMKEKIISHSAERISLMRLFHYLTPDEYSYKEGKEIIGSSPHTDWGYLTLIFSTQVGLEVSLENEKGETEW